ncbi:MAG: hypothetical protein RLY43_1, partial [Bacteroidota bacterium]
NLSKHTYNANGVQTEFPYTFSIFTTDGSDIELYTYDPDTEITTQITSNYSVDTEALTVTYPSTGTALASPMQIILLRVVNITQDVDLVNGGAFYAETIETSLDKLTAITQQLDEEVARSFKWSPAHTGEETDPATFIISLNESVAAAALSETNAAASEANALSSANNAATSETNALNSANNAAISETNALNSANSATISETNAAASAATALGASASAWVITTTYNYPDIVAYTDGYTYRCIGANILGEIPSTSINWVRAAVVYNDFFDIDEDGGLMPALSPLYSADFELDSNGDIQPKL